MFYLALLIIIPLTLAAVIGFTCAWLLQRQAVLHACREFDLTRKHIEEISAQLQTFRQMERQMSNPSNRLSACQTELRLLENKMERLLDDATGNRKEIG